MTTHYQNRMTKLHDLLDTDPAAGLRGVAALMRSRAEAATPGPWEAMEYDDYPGDEGVALLGSADTPMGRQMIGYFHVLSREEQEANGAHASAWHPAVALAVADLLARVADDYDIAKHGYWSAVAEKIARAYLGERDA